MLVYMNISRNGFNMEEVDNNDPEMKRKFEERINEVTQKLLLSTIESEDQTLYRRLSERQQNSRGGIGATEARTSTQGRTTKSKPIDPEAIYSWPKTLKMDFCWRLPIDSQRVMIYEKLAYSIEAIEEHRIFADRYSDKCDQVSE